MGKPLDITERTFEFAVRVVMLCQVLDEEPGVARTLSFVRMSAMSELGLSQKQLHNPS